MNYFLRNLRISIFISHNQAIQTYRFSIRSIYAALSSPVSTSFPVLLVPEPGKKRERERGWFDLRSSGEERGLLSRTAAGAMESPSLYKKSPGNEVGAHNQA